MTVTMTPISTVPYTTLPYLELAHFPQSRCHQWTENDIHKTLSLKVVCQILVGRQHIGKAGLLLPVFGIFLCLRS